jgi:phosphatidylserine/phosphatidylglycerophosphate/cardiolipin synthase-like enzyme
VNGPQPQHHVDWAKVIAAPVRAGNRVDWLVDGWATYESMYAAIETALRGDSSAYYLYLLGWWLDEMLPLKQGEAETAFFILLAKLADKGVQLRVMLYDNFLKSAYAFFFSAGMLPKAQIAAINHLKGAAAILDGHTVPQSFQSHHQKLLLVRGSQGLVGFCGGIDLSYDRVRPVKRHPGSPFHDVHCRIEGPAARDLVDVFVQRWTAHPEGAKTKDTLRGLADLPPVRREADQKGPGDTRVGIIRTFVRPEGPCIAEQSIDSTLSAAIAAARRFIYCEDQYMVSLNVAAALGKALAHVQFVYILIPHTSISDLPRAWSARAAFIDKVFENARKENTHKFHVFYKLGSLAFGKPEREGLQRPPHDPPTAAEVPKARDFGLHTYVHAKTWIFDDELAIIGSANCNRRGLYFDSEVGAAIFDVPSSMSKGRLPFAQQLRAHLWAEHLGVDPSAVRNAIDRKTMLKWFDKDVQRYVRHYRQDDGSDADSVTGWFVAPPFAGEQQGSSSDFVPSVLTGDDVRLPRDEAERAWDWLLDPPELEKQKLKKQKLKKCP